MPPPCIRLPILSGLQHLHFGEAHHSVHSPRKHQNFESSLVIVHACYLHVFSHLILFIAPGGGYYSLHFTDCGKRSCKNYKQFFKHSYICCAPDLKSQVCLLCTTPHCPGLPHPSTPTDEALSLQRRLFPCRGPMGDRRPAELPGCWVTTSAPQEPSPERRVEKF